MMLTKVTRRAFVAGGTALVAAPWVSRAHAQEEITLNVGHEVAVDHPLHAGWTEAARVAEESSGGRIKLSIFPSSQFGSGREMFLQVADGSLDVMMFGWGGVAAFEPKVGIFDIPYLARDWDQMARMLQSPWAKAVFDGMIAKHNVHVTGNSWYYGSRQFTSSRGLKMPTDAAGLKIRVPENQTSIAMIRALQASPTPMALSEVYLALQTGVADGQENPLPTIASNKFFEVQKFLSLTSHQINAFPVLFNEGRWQGLSDGDRTILLDAFNAGGETNNAATFAREAGLVETLRGEGMEIVESDRDAFRSAMDVVYAEFTPVFGEGAIADLQAL